MRRLKYSEANVPDHLRVVVRYLKGDHWVTACCLMERDSDAIVAMASSTCSLKDNPVRKIGRAIAVGRALKNFHEGTPCPS